MVSTISLSQFEEAVHMLSQKATVEGKSFDDVFSIDGVSLWWFYNRFITRSILPGMPKFNVVLERYKSKNKYSFLEKIYFYLVSSFLRKLLLVSDWFRFVLAPKNVGVSKYKHAVLFLTYTTHHTPQGIYRLSPILKELTKAHIKSLPLTVAPFFDLHFLKIRKISPIFYTFITKDIKRSSRESAAKMSKLWIKQGKSALRKSCQEADPHLWNFIKPHCSFLFSRDFLYVFFLYYQTTKRVINLINPPLFCITSGIGLLDKCVIATAHHTKTPTLLIQHGVGADFRRTDMRAFDMLFFSVFGENDKSLLEETGIPSARIFVTGSSPLDDLGRKDIHKQKNSTIRKILLLSQPFVEDGRWTKKQLELFLLEIGCFMDAPPVSELAIKLHPRDKLKTYRQFRGRKNVKVTQGDLYQHIQEADLVMGVNSTALSEALFLNRPVLILDIFDEVKDDMIVKSGLALKAKSFQEAFTLLPKFLSFFYSDLYDKKKEEYIKNNFYSLDGNSAARVAATIKKIKKNDEK